MVFDSSPFFTKKVCGKSLSHLDTFGTKVWRSEILVHFYLKVTKFSGSNTGKQCRSDPFNVFRNIINSFYINSTIKGSKVTVLCSYYDFPLHSHLITESPVLYYGQLTCLFSITSQQSKVLSNIGKSVQSCSFYEGCLQKKNVHLIETVVDVRTRQERVTGPFY